jgi:phage shock protein E
VNWYGRQSSDATGAASAPWDENALILDVRSPGEFASGHVDGAVNLPLDRFVDNYAALAPDKAQQIVMYCQSGARSGQAVQFLAQQGYTKVVNGISAGAVALKTGRPIRRD